MKQELVNMECDIKTFLGMIETEEYKSIIDIPNCKPIVFVIGVHNGDVYFMLDEVLTYVRECDKAMLEMLKYRLCVILTRYFEFCNFEVTIKD